jgi:hypothetical protein
MCMLKLNKTILKTVNRAMRQCLWEKQDKDHHNSLPAWELVCQPKDKGELMLWLLGASKVVRVDHRRTSSSSAFWCRNWRFDGVAGDRSREIRGSGIPGRR